MFRGGVGIHLCGSLDYNRMDLGGHFLVAFLFFSLLFPSFPLHFFLPFFFLPETKFQSVTKNGLELVAILLPQCLECWDLQAGLHFLLLLPVSWHGLCGRE